MNTAPLERAIREASNPSMGGAIRKGWTAAVAGKGLDACPYKDHWTGSGRLSWSRAWQRAWMQGHKLGREALGATE